MAGSLTRGWLLAKPPLSVAPARAPSGPVGLTWGHRSCSA